MGHEISRLWWWDPTPDMIKELKKIANQHDGPPRPKPHPIHHPSRDGTTFSTERVIVPLGTQTMFSSNQDLRTFELPTGQILLGTNPSFSRDGDELLLTPGHDGLVDMGDADKEIIPGAMSLPVMYEWDFQSIEGTETSDDIDAMENVEEQPPTGLSSSEVLSWVEQVAESVPEPLPLLPGSFERGVMGGMSTNDILMIKGLIHPLVYIEFCDLGSFSCHSTHTS